jgi:adenylosuccinate lyase
MLAIYKKTKKKVWAHTVLHRCARKSSAENRHFSEVVLEDEEIGKLFSKEELERLMDLTTYTGTAVKQVENVADYINEKSKEDHKKYG